jgi:hypothetical protein
MSVSTTSNHDTTPSTHTVKLQAYAEPEPTSPDIQDQPTYASGVPLLLISLGLLLSVFCLGLVSRRPEIQLDGNPVC